MWFFGQHLLHSLSSFPQKMHHQVFEVTQKFSGMSFGRSVRFFFPANMSRQFFLVAKDAPSCFYSPKRCTNTPGVVQQVCWLADCAHCGCLGLSSSSGHVVLDPEYANSSLFLHPLWLPISPSESPDFGWYARQPLSSPFLLTNTSIYGHGTPARRTLHPLSVSHATTTPAENGRGRPAWAQPSERRGALRRGNMGW